MQILFVASEVAPYSKTGGLADVAAALPAALGNPPFNFMFHSNPLRDAPSPSYHWHIELMPALTQVAGFEWGSGFYINPTVPEEAAKYLREMVA